MVVGPLFSTKVFILMKIETNALQLIVLQLKNNFLLTDKEKEELEFFYDKVLDKIEVCFKDIKSKYFSISDETYFNPYHSGQYATFLYYYSRVVYESGNRILADKIYYLNKMLNACDLFYEVNLPDIFYHEHPIGSVIGRGEIGDYFVYQQNCTIGGNKGYYPKLGKFVWLHANSSIIGKCNIGNNVFIAANVLVKDEDIPDNTIVFGSSPNLLLKYKPPEYFLDKSLFKSYC